MEKKVKRIINICQENIVIERDSYGPTAWIPQGSEIQEKIARVIRPSSKQGKKKNLNPLNSSSRRRLFEEFEQIRSRPDLTDDDIIFTMRIFISKVQERE